MRVGIVGGGQLARMLALAGYPLGIQCVVLDPASDACAGQVAELIVSAYDDPKGLTQLAERCDVITFDFENVPQAAAEQLQQHSEVYPPPKALGIAQDRLSEKTLCNELGIKTAPYAAINDLSDLQTAAASIGLPAILKTRCLGYDGKGQQLLRTEDELQSAYETLGNVPLILEGFVPFEREVSLIAVRSRTEETAFYPLVENQHREGILRLSKAPYEDTELQQQAIIHAEKLLNHLDYVGILAIEFFVVAGELLVNEIAPRVHNSGHWTIEGAMTSQFENHLRAILGWPLGSPQARGYSAMINCIGELMPLHKVLQESGAHFHDYGKQPRPGRKVGHVTLCAEDSNNINRLLDEF